MDENSDQMPGLNPDDYEDIRTLRDGRFTCVKLIQNKETKKLYTMTQIKLEKVKLKPNPNIMLKLQRLYECRHASTINHIGYMLGESFPKIICEYPSGGPLLSRMKVEKMDGNEKFSHLYGIACAMKKLHDDNIIHSDLKIKSIYLNEENTPVVADFAPFQFVSRVVNRDSPIKTNIWIAPELFKGEETTKKSDVYAFGSILLYYYTKKFVYGRKITRAPFSELIQNGARAIIPDFVPLYTKRLIMNCWAQRPEDRPTFAQIVTSLKSHYEFVFFGVTKDFFMKYLSHIESIDGYEEAPVEVIKEEVPKFDFTFPEKSKSYNALVDDSGLDPAGRYIAAIYMHLQQILLMIDKDNIKEAAEAILASPFIQKEELMPDLVENIMQVMRAHYRNISVMSLFVNSIVQKVPVLKDYILDAFRPLIGQDSFFPEKLPDVALLYFLLRKRVFTKDEILSKIRNALEIQPLPKLFLSVFFCYFAPEIETDKELFDKLEKLVRAQSENCFFPLAFKHFFEHYDFYRADNWKGIRMAVEEDYSVDRLKRILKEDDYNALKDVLRHPESWTSARIQSEVFDPCPIAHDRPSIGNAAPLYDALNCFQVLQMAGFDLTTKDQKTRFLPSFIVGGGSLRFFKTIDKKNTDFDSAPNMCASFYRNSFLYKIQKMCPMDLNRPDKFGHLVINAAVIANNVEIFLYCVKKGVSVQVRENFGWSPAHWAAFKGRVTMLRIMRGMEAVDINIKDDWGVRPLHLAAEYGDPATILEILQYPRLNVNARTADKRTALHMAVESGSTDNVVSLLNDKRIDTTIKDRKGRTAADLAIKRERKDLAEIIISASSSAQSV